MEAGKVVVTLEQVKDYEFRVTFEPGMAPVTIDEGPPIGQGHGPSPARMLATAVGGCLCASLLYCLRKARVEPRKMTATVSNTVARNEAKRLRITEQRVRIVLDADGDEIARAARCLESFEDFCTVTGSVRSGIDIHLEVVDGDGRVLRPAGESAG
jgi:uncharacterized OsmC-like protein